MISIYNSSFNIVSAGFDWKPVLQNWLDFLNGTGQIVIAVNKSTDDTPKVLREWFAKWKEENIWSHTKIDVIDIDISYDDPEFDGKGKAAALEKCTEPYCTLLDLDEVIVPSQRRLWRLLCQELERSPYDGFMIPVVDLIGKEDRLKSIGAKWYLHRNRPQITRGVVKFAYREDGSIDKTKSDTCEAIYGETGELIHSAAIINLSLPPQMILPALETRQVPFVYHLGYLNLEQRLKRAEFWRPVWDNRDKKSSEPKLTLEDLKKIPRIKHNLLSWKTI